VLNQVEYVVLDEADRMLDIGFLPDLQRILAYLPKQRQTLLFSATFSPEIRRLAQSYLQDPITVEVARPNATATNVEQRFYSVTDEDKRNVVRQILKQRELSQAIVFVNSKLGAARLARSFERDGLRTSALHGDKSQDERLKSLAAFKAGEVDVLVATDVAARGLDIADLPAVFNFDVPFNAEDYVHRIGRTGRAGASGLAVTLVTRDDNRLVADIEKLIKKKLDIESFELEDDRPRRARYRDEDTREARAPVVRPERIDGVEGEAGAESVRQAEPPARPARREDGQPPYREPRDRTSRSPDRPRRAPADPFFEKPYEASGSGEASWEKAAPATAAPGQASAVSPNIRPKKRVASLLGGA